MNRLRVKPAKSGKSSAPAKPKAAKAKTPKAKTTDKAAKGARPARPQPKSSKALASGRSRKPEPTQAKAPAPKKPAVIEKPRPKPLPGAIQAYEQGVKLMYAESYEKAIKSFSDLIEAYPEEVEIQAAARARIQACQKRLELAERAVFRSPDDHYNMGVAMMNRGEIDEALGHFQNALKMAPKSDHILYALAAASALKGAGAQAVAYLKQSIQYRNENRFQAASDADFAALADDPAFRELLTTPGK